MTRARLRIYYGPEQQEHEPEPAAPEPVRRTVDLSLGEVFAVLADALQGRRGWLKDFADDTITISADLYDVLQAYQRLRRPPA